MQIISRRVNEGIIIGEETQITVLDIGENSVELEIRSPDDEFCEVVTLFLRSDEDGAFQLKDDSEAVLTAAIS